MIKKLLQISKIRYILGVVIVLGIVAKLALFDFQYVDYGFYLSRWIEEIKANGYLSALKEPFYNYTPTYMYLLTLIAKLDIYPLYAIKAVSVLFDYVLAFFVGRLAYLYWKTRLTMWLSFAIVPLVPTILLNSAFMSQCDAIYVSFIMGSIYFLFSARRWTAVIFLGIAFALKIQTAMILPFFFVYMLKGRIQWNYFLVIPVIYFISIIPAWIAGRPLLDLLTIYASQAEYNEGLVGNFPNIYVWLKDLGIDEIVKYAGLAIVIVLTLLAGFFLRKERYKFNYVSWMKLIFLSAIICPFFLPGMLERYMYLGDVMAVLMLIITRKYIIQSLGILFVSFYSYVRCIYIFSFSEDALYPSTPFSFFELLPWQVVSVLYFGIIVYAVYDFFKTLERVKIEKKEEVESETMGIDSQNYYL